MNNTNNTDNNRISIIIIIIIIIIIPMIITISRIVSSPVSCHNKWSPPRWPQLLLGLVF